VITRNEQVSGSSPLVGSLFYLQNQKKGEAHDVRVEGFVSSTSAVGYPKASSPALACYKWLQGTAGSVGESYGIERLTEVPGFQRLRHTGRSVAASGYLLTLFTRVRGTGVLPGSSTTAGCGDIDPCAPCMCERVSTPSNEGYARIMLRGSTTLKTAVESQDSTKEPRCLACLRSLLPRVGLKKRSTSR
jgi:hypothetical protein